MMKYQGQARADTQQDMCKGFPGSIIRLYRMSMSHDQFSESYPLCAETLDEKGFGRIVEAQCTRGKQLEDSLTFHNLILP